MAETAAVAGAVLGAESFEYNRQNYMYDREQRLIKEFKEMDFRIDQSSQWRADLKHVCDLQEKKSKTYCLVAVITVGFSMSLWCQGRLPIGTPTWIMLGNQVAAGGGFAFLTMVIWLGIYASVSAQGYLTRLLTQLVRLPIPTWPEMEACRTYGSSFEKLEGRQLFRVPFLMGSQERLVTQNQSNTEASSTDRNDGTETTGVDAANQSRSSQLPIDPWGIEASKADTYELGCVYGKEVAKLRHIKLVRHAALFWQSYDAFGRMSLTVGITQVMIGLSYFILGNMCMALNAPFAAFAGVFALVCCTVSITRLDVAFPWWQSLLVYGFLIGGPVFACLGCYQISGPHALTIHNEQKARYWLCAAFTCHALLSVSMCVFGRIKETSAGDLVPTAFSSVLWLDAFGWVPRHQGRGENAIAAGEQLSPRLRSTISSQRPAAPTAELRPTATSADQVQHYAMDYLQSRDAGGQQNMAQASSPRGAGSNPQPTLGAVRYDDQTGESVPSRYEERAPVRAADDMRHLDGAPRHWHALDANRPPPPFFDAQSFFPRKVHHDDDKVEEICTGHSGERPGVLPWRVFLSISALLALVWTLAATYQVLFCLDLARWANFPAGSKPMAALQVQHFETAERLAMSLPIVHMEARSLSCDESGQHFAVSDGLSIYSAKMNGSLQFQDTQPCRSLLGEALDDIALSCDHGTDERAASCKIMALHRNGERLTSCSLKADGAEVTSSQVQHLLQQWLKTADRERAASLLGSAACKGTCTSVGTTHGRVADLQHISDEVVPERVLPQLTDDQKLPVHDERTIVRSLNDRYVASLHPKHGHIQLLDTTRDLADAGLLMLPIRAPVASFCVGNGQLFLMTDESAPQMWRMPLPTSLAL